MDSYWTKYGSFSIPDGAFWVDWDRRGEDKSSFRIELNKFLPYLIVVNECGIQASKRRGKSGRWKFGRGNV